MIDRHVPREIDLRLEQHPNELHSERDFWNTGEHLAVDRGLETLPMRMSYPSANDVEVISPQQGLAAG